MEFYFQKRQNSQGVLSKGLLVKHQARPPDGAESRVVRRKEGVGGLTAHVSKLTNVRAQWSQRTAQWSKRQETLGL